MSPPTHDVGQLLQLRLGLELGRELSSFPLSFPDLEDSTTTIERVQCSGTLGTIDLGEVRQPLEISGDCDPARHARVAHPSATNAVSTPLCSAGGATRRGVQAWCTSAPTIAHVPICSAGSVTRRDVEAWSTRSPARERVKRRRC